MVMESRPPGRVVVAHTRKLKVPDDDASIG